MHCGCLPTDDRFPLNGWGRGLFFFFPLVSQGHLHMHHIISVTVQFLPSREYFLHARVQKQTSLPPTCLPLSVLRPFYTSCWHFSCGCQRDLIRGANYTVLRERKSLASEAVELADNHLAQHLFESMWKCGGSAAGQQLWRGSPEARSLTFVDWTLLNLMQVWNVPDTLHPLENLLQDTPFYPKTAGEVKFILNFFFLNGLGKESNFYHLCQVLKYSKDIHLFYSLTLYAGFLLIWIAVKGKMARLRQCVPPL